jgi:hypothetical protein
VFPSYFKGLSNIATVTTQWLGTWPYSKIFDYPKKGSPQQNTVAYQNRSSMTMKKKNGDTSVKFIELFSPLTLGNNISQSV